MSGPFKMKGAGEVYYDGNGDPINLNPKNMIKLTGDEKYDEYGNEQYMNKNTKDYYYKKKPRGESPWEKMPAPGSDKIIIPPRNFA